MLVDIKMSLLLNTNLKWMTRLNEIFLMWINFVNAEPKPDKC